MDLNDFSTGEILRYLKRKYVKEPAIIDYIEMIECEIRGLKEAEK